MTEWERGNTKGQQTVRSKCREQLRNEGDEMPKLAGVVKRTARLACIETKKPRASGANKEESKRISLSKAET